MLHGDDWKFNEPKLRAKTLETLKKVGTKLIEIPYTKNISSFLIPPLISLLSIFLVSTAFIYIYYEYDDNNNSSLLNTKN